MRIILLLIGVAVLLSACAVHSYLPFYGTSQWNSFYQGGDGSSTQNAVIINTNDDDKTIDAENHYLDTILQRQGKTYIVTGRQTYDQDGRVYDRIDIVVNQSVQTTYHFDVTIPRSHAIRG
jgi:hypothetical protein